MLQLHSPPPPGPLMPAKACLFRPPSPKEYTQLPIAPTLTLRNSLLELRLHPIHSLRQFQAEPLVRRFAFAAAGAERVAVPVQALEVQQALCQFAVPGLVHAQHAI